MNISCLKDGKVSVRRSLFYLTEIQENHLKNAFEKWLWNIGCIFVLQSTQTLQYSEMFQYEFSIKLSTKVIETFFYRFLIFFNPQQYSETNHKCCCPRFGIWHICELEMCMVFEFNKKRSLLPLHRVCWLCETPINFGVKHNPLMMKLIKDIVQWYDNNNVRLLYFSIKWTRTGATLLQKWLWSINVSLMNIISIET